MRRRGGVALAVLIVLVCAISGCQTGGESLQEATIQCGDAPVSEDQTIEQARAEAEAWLQFEKFEDPGGEPALAVLSFPGDDHLNQRTYLYDQALAILWFSSVGDDRKARRLARTLVALQKHDGSWGFSFDAGEKGFYDHGYVRTGSVAWAGWALAYHAARADDDDAQKAAERAASYAESRQLGDDHGEIAELYAAGAGYHDPNTGERTLGERVDFVATEHQFDVHMLLRALDPGAADALEERLLQTVWLRQEGRFAMGGDGHRRDERRALDVSGGWGALWLLSVDRRQLAETSLEFTLDRFPADDSSPSGGFVPYLDEVEGYRPEDELIFVEGSLGVALAALRLDRPDTTRRILKMAARLGNARGPGIPYANRSDGDFTDTPAAASTLWFLMVHRELTTGEAAPVFLPASIEPNADGQ